MIKTKFFLLVVTMWKKIEQQKIQSELQPLQSDAHKSSNPFINLFSCLGEAIEDET